MGADMRTLIAIPCMDQVSASFFESMMYLQRTPEDGLAIIKSSLIYDARNTLGQLAVSNKAEYIFWLDSDMVFESDLLERMFKAIGDKDFISALYFKRRPPYEPCIFKVAGFKQGEGNEVIPIAETYTDYKKDSVFEIEACGFGCVLMKTSMFLQIQETQGLPFSPVLGFGEDISFCIKAQEAGFKMYCDSSIKCDHTAHILVNEQTFEVWRKNNVE